MLIRATGPGTPDKGRGGSMKRRLLTHHTVRCPLQDGPANVTVSTDPGGSPSRRNLGVTACSLRPTPAFVPPARSVYFSDLAPPVAYLRDVAPTPYHASEVACSNRWLP